MATIGNVTIRIGANTNQLQYDLRKAENAIKKAAANMQGLGERLSLGLTAPLTLAGGAAFKMASDVEESLNKVRVAFGHSAGSVEKFAETTLTTYGIARGTALDMSALFGDMATSMGLPQDEAAKLSTSLVGLAGDLASFKNISIGEVQTALSGIFTGETESLKRLGIVMLETNLNAFALAQGINKKVQEMTQAEKVALRYNYILTQTKNAQGDFARTSDGAANQMRIFQESLKEVGASLGQVLLPVITPIIQKLNEWLKAFRELSPETKKVIVIVAGLAAALGPLLIVFSQLYLAVQNVRLAMLGFAKASVIASSVGSLVTFLQLATKSAAGFNVAMTVLTSEIISAISAMLKMTGITSLFTFLKLATNGVAGFKVAMAVLSSEIIFLTKNIIAISGLGSLITFFKLATTSVAGFTVAIKVLSAAFVTLIKTNPFLIGLAAAATAVYLIYKNWELVKDTLREVGNFFIRIANNVRAAFGLEPLKEFRKEIKNTFEDISKLKGFENVLQPGKIPAPVGVLAPDYDPSKKTVTTGGNKEVKTLTDQIKDLKDNIDKLSIAYAQKPSAGILEQLNSQIDKLKQKESILENAENLVTRLSGGDGGKVQLLPEIDFSGALNTIKDFATKSSEAIRTETKKGLLDGLSVTYEESGFQSFIASLETDLLRIQRQFDGGLIGGLEKNAGEFDTLFGSLQNLQKNGFSQLSPEILHVKGLLDEFGGFDGFSDLLNGVNRITNGLKAFGEGIGLIGNSFTQMIDSQIAKIDQKEENEIAAIRNSMMNEETKQKMISDVEAKAEKKRKELQRRQAIANKAMSLYSATVATFQAVTQALTIAPPLGIALAAIVGGMGAANIAAIASTPLPSLAIGTDYVKSDGMAYLHKGEAVVPADVVGGGFSRSMQLYSVIRGDDIYLTNKRAEYNKTRTS